MMHFLGLIKLQILLETIVQVHQMMAMWFHRINLKIQSYFAYRKVQRSENHAILLRDEKLLCYTWMEHGWNTQFHYYAHSQKHLKKREVLSAYDMHLIRMRCFCSSKHKESLWTKVPNGKMNQVNAKLVIHLDKREDVQMQS